MKLEVFHGEAKGNYQREEFKSLVESLPDCEFAYWKNVDEPAEKDWGKTLRQVRRVNVHDVLVWNIEGVTLVYDGRILVHNKRTTGCEDVERRAKIYLIGKREKAEGLSKLIKDMASQSSPSEA